MDEAKATDNAIDARRALLRQWVGGKGPEIDAAVPPGTMGVAFSGGGIRSATLSLGLAQALARAGRLLDFDYCSTVSGGGYFGSFLGSLFLPDSARGGNAGLGATDSVILDEANLAQAVLSSRSDATLLRWDERTLRHPVRWLREHSRYLAPNGASDYLPAAAYMARNWLAMLYVFLLPVVFLATVMTGLTAWTVANADPNGTLRAPLSAAPMAANAAGCLQPVRAGACAQPFHLLPSLLWWPVLALAFVTLAVWLGYWYTEVLSSAGRGQDQRSRGKQSPAWARLTAGIVLWLAAIGVGWAAWRQFPSGEGASLMVLAGVLLAVIGALAALLAAYLSQHAKVAPDDAYTADVRSRLTRWGGNLLGLSLGLAALATINALGLSAYDWIARQNQAGIGLRQALGLALAPLGAWLINKLPGWVSGDGKLAAILGRHVWTLALAAGVLLYGLVSVGADVTVQALLFDGQRWVSGLPGQWNGQIVVIALVVVLGLMMATGWATGFINLSSLHGIYAARLTRAYVGATNINRLQGGLPRPEARPGKGGDAAKPITETDPGDQVPIAVYQQQRTLAPLHLINVTLNETVSSAHSQLLERDRKGVPMVFAPEGLFVNATTPGTPTGAFFAWSALEAAGVEGLSLGQLCAISGAAASTGMGSRTTLGGSLALCFANIRLGYWWHVDMLLRESEGEPRKRKAWHFTSRLFRTFFYLGSEMRGYFTRRYSRVYLSDGGHFENSGAYELLRRRVRTIVVADNGADPGFVFEDLENLARKARIDLGFGLEVAKPTKVQHLVGSTAAALFLNGEKEDWRLRAARRSAPGTAASPIDRAFCLLLEVHGRTVPEDDNSYGVIGHIVWIKPRLCEGVSADVTGYATAHSAFPHETTGDQFFDEAQWESYRRLGFFMMEELLSTPDRQENLLRQINDPARW